jgi:transcriptional regulator with XRE-family HTH domain
MISERQKLRRRAGLTLAQLSRRTDISAGRLSEFERGEIQLSPDDLMRVAVVLATELGIPIPSTASDIFLALEKFRVCERGAVTA